ncbi:MAG TPA: Mut7-C RNAse domain-containing protein [Pseudonocardiaceae bacterium]|nr:Mut7-C RNAse domain-containing protein [Pseudonocardiaceae bacterium]
MQLSPELWLFVAPRHRREQVEVRHDSAASLGHLVEALGIPLTEVGALLADDALVTPSHRPPAGATLQVRPVQRPQQVPGWDGQFLLDVHLGTLARRLRLLGIDAAYSNDADDEALIEQARRQHRVLLTQDRGLLRRRALWAGAYVRGARSAEQTTDVLDRFAQPLSPFTRCTTCNGWLEPVAKHEVASVLQPGTRRCYDVYARCRSCGQVYWHGAHGRRLDAIIEAAVRDHPDP